MRLSAAVPGIARAPAVGPSVVVLSGRGSAGFAERPGVGFPAGVASIRLVSSARASTRAGGGRPAKGGVHGSLARSGRATVTAAATPRRQETGNGSALIGAREEPSAPFTLRSPTSVGTPRKGSPAGPRRGAVGCRPDREIASPRRCVRRSSDRCGPASHRRRRSRSGSPAPLLCLDGGLEPPPGWLLNPRAARGPALAAPRSAGGPRRGRYGAPSFSAPAPVGVAIPTSRAGTVRSTRRVTISATAGVRRRPDVHRGPVPRQFGGSP